MDSVEIHHDMEYVNLCNKDVAQEVSKYIATFAPYSEFLFGEKYCELSQAAWWKAGETRRERLKSALYLSLKKRKTFFWKKLEIFEKNFSFGKCRVVPKNVKGGPFLIYKHTFCCKITKNSKGGPFGDIKKISKKKSHSAEKNSKGGPCSSVRFCILR